MLALVGEPYDFVDVEGFDHPGAAQDRLAAVNPLRQVPTLVLDDGDVLTETAAIALWLADRHAGLAPASGSAEHRRFLRLLIWIVANVYPTFTYGDYPKRWAPSAQDELTNATNAHRERLYGWLEEQVVGPYVSGGAGVCPGLLRRGDDRLASGREWFADNTPRLFAGAKLMRRDPRLAAVMAHNKLTVD